MSGGLLTEAFLTALLTGAVTAGVPLLLAGLGEQMSQKAGVLNIGLEGMMLAGAYAGFIVTLHMGASPWGAAAGLGAALGAGLLAGAVMAGLAVRLGLNQIVIGIALLLGLEGLTAILHHLSFAQSYPRLPAAASWAAPGLAHLPLIGPAVFDRPPMVHVALLLVPLCAALYRLTHAGLALRAAGDGPRALDAAGGNVRRVRTVAVLAAGALAGLGGGFMAIVGAGVFVPFMTNGAGFIAIVLAMLARGRPLLVLAGALLFGGCLSAATALQVAGVDAPTDIVQMLPFAAVLLVLALFGRRGALPAALGETWDRERT
ncbi:MAG: ABC transporter permease [Pseudochelatococcus sp.]|uniref:ABC transporter permease n=1 Tax=Pseudochelatococcus sp. TaxID=2020869 RepID=UPI003D92F54C